VECAQVQFFRFSPHTRAGYARPPLEIAPILQRLAPETVELIGAKQKARHCVSNLNVLHGGLITKTGKDNDMKT
jgi:hypothetical protein